MYYNQHCFELFSVDVSILSGLDDKMNYKCSICEYTCGPFAEIIDHMIIKHPNDELRIKKLVRKGPADVMFWQSKNFHVTPSVVKDNGCFIYSEPTKGTIKISKLKATDNNSKHSDQHPVSEGLIGTPDRKTSVFVDDSPFKSPISKKLKFTSTPNKFSPIKPILGETDCEDVNPCLDELEQDLSEDFSNMSIEEIEEGDIGDTSDVSYLISLIPDVLANLDASNQKDTFIKFNKMVAEGTFPMTNIAYLLFLDIVEWFSNDSTTQMRYPEETKIFWRVGMKLFKGKFLRYMSGLKNAGQGDMESRCSGLYNPMESQVNFAVPKRAVLDKMASPVQTFSPGILTEMISKISASDPDHIETFKVCVDGKKLNAGVRGQNLGDVNLWGFEEAPKLQDRTLRLERELKVVESLKDELELLEIKDYETFSDIEGVRKGRILSLLKNCIHILSDRLHDLRVGKVGQKTALEKLMGQVSGDWRLSRYGFAISGIRTKIFEIDSCTSITLRSIDTLCKASSVLSGTIQQFSFSDTVQLGFQKNYACLKGITEREMVGSADDNSVLSIVSQRSPAWFSVRKNAVLTGSTCFKALGFDGLKSQKNHYETVFQGKIMDDPDEETLKRMMHGSKNEINAVATLVSKIMPVYFPHKVFVEEGCYRLQDSSCPCFIVSPDGSLREKGTEENSGIGKPFAAVEIKCPYPGKRFTTEVRYKLPVYYVPQVLSEMVALQVPTLLFVSYSEWESTVLLMVEFDNDLWESLLSIASDIYPVVNSQPPKRLHPRLKVIRKDMERFRNTNVTFVCEVQSVKAIKCSHEIVSMSIERHFRHQCFFTESEVGVETSEFLKIAHNCALCVNSAWGLCRQKATEVLVFLVAMFECRSCLIPFLLHVSQQMRMVHSVL